MLNEKLEITRAVWADREELLNEIESAFDNKVDFRNNYPYLFQKNRIDNHYICRIDGKIVGAVGVYPYTLKIRGIDFNTAGIGQVFCKTEYRGRSVMSSILNVVNNDLKVSNLDFSWLFGDRRRYSRFGWATGGLRKTFIFNKEYLPKKIETQFIREVIGEEDVLYVYNSFIKQNDTTIVSFEDFKLVLSVPSSGGLILNDSFILWQKDKTTIVASAGNPEEIATLLAFQLRGNLKDGLDNIIKMECSTFNYECASAGIKYYEDLNIENAANFRVERLASLVDKICKVKYLDTRLFEKGLTIGNMETGETVLIKSLDDKITVSNFEGDPDILLKTYELSDLIFSNFTVESVNPYIKNYKVLNNVFPFNAYVSNFIPV